MVDRKGFIFYAIAILASYNFAGADESFECGFTRCSKRTPYEFCVVPPLISEGESPYCLNCESQQDLCGTDKQQAGCNLYCQDYLAEKQKGNCQDHNLRGDSSDGRPTININRKLFIGICILVGCLVLILSSSLGYLVMKTRKKRKENLDDDIERSSVSMEHSKEESEVAEKVEDTHETSGLLQKTSSHNPTGSTGNLYSTDGNPSDELNLRKIKAEPTNEDQSPTGNLYSTDGNPSDELNLRKIKAEPTNEDQSAKYVPS